MIDVCHRMSAAAKPSDVKTAASVPAKRKPRVVIIGGGLSGIACAYELLYGPITAPTPSGGGGSGGSSESKPGSGKKHKKKGGGGGGGGGGKQQQSSSKADDDDSVFEEFKTSGSSRTGRVGAADDDPLPPLTTEPPIELIVVEGKERIGGRVTALDLGGTSGGQVVSLGGSWVHGQRKNPLLVLSKHLNGGGAGHSGDGLLVLGGVEHDATLKSIVIDEKTGADITNRHYKVAEQVKKWWSVLEDRVDDTFGSDEEEKAAAKLKDSSLAIELDKLASKHRERLQKAWGMDSAEWDKHYQFVKHSFESLYACRLDELAFPQFWDEYEQDEVGGHRVSINGFEVLVQRMAKRIVAAGTKAGRTAPAPAPTDTKSTASDTKSKTAPPPTAAATAAPVTPTLALADGACTAIKTGIIIKSIAIRVPLTASGSAGGGSKKKKKKPTATAAAAPSPAPAKTADSKSAPVAAPTPTPAAPEYPIRITTHNGDTIDCDYVVCTVPLGVLQHSLSTPAPAAITAAATGTSPTAPGAATGPVTDLTFDPPLPAYKTGAIQRLGMGLLNKVVLTFNTQFWPKSIHWIEVLPDRFGGDQKSNASSKEPAIVHIPYFQNYCQFFTDPPVLVAFLAADSADRFEAFTDAQLTELCLSILSKRFTDAVVRKSFIRAHTTRWRADPFARGSYSYYRCGSSGADYDALAQPILIPAGTGGGGSGSGGGIHFAGEHTNRRYPGTVHGAYDSGRREAHAIKKLLQKQFSIPFFK